MSTAATVDERGTHAHGGSLGALAVAALGVVFGDIGTSPLYTLQVGIAPKPGEMPAMEDVLGVCSLIVWALTMVVTVKYLAFVMRADNQGEGGILALLALVPRNKHARIGLVAILVIAGAALLYGDGIITPAISVLSALEGLELTAPGLKQAVVPLTCLVLLGLFAIQRRGTGGLGAIFGPVMIAWFVCIGSLGAWHVVKNPAVLVALSPQWGASYFMRHGFRGLPILGIVVLAVTGGEALYADMGHFGRRPVRLAWLALVFPTLVLCYLGQGALVMRDASAVENPFFAMVPPGASTYALVAISTAATIIASQSLITGVFSLTHQAVQLGYFPRVTVVHTSHKAEGQIYIPEINYALMVACVALVLSFKSSSNLAAAYGIAVTGTMAITSFLYLLVCRRNWHYTWTTALALFIPFVAIDLSFFSANVEKIAAGGWFPLAVGIGVFVVMTTWWRGRYELSRTMETGVIPDELFLSDIAETPLPRVSGTAVFMASGTDGMPNVLLHHVKHNKVLHKQVVLLSVVTQNVPFAIGNQSLTVRELGHGFYRVVANVGFMQQPNVPRILTRCERHGLSVNASDTTYYLGRQTLLTTGHAHVARWRKMLFSFLARNSRPPTAFFNLPPNRVVELGLQIEL